MKSPGVLAVVLPGGARREYQVPVECVPRALARDAAVLSCGAGDQEPPAVVDLATADVSRLALPAGVETLSPVAVGRYWVLGEASSHPDGIHLSETLLAISRTRGQAVDLGRGDRMGVHTYADLDRTGLRRALCRPVVRARFGAQLARYAIISKVGAWTLQSAAGTQYPQRCGSRTLTRFNRNAHAVLGPDLTAYLYGRTVRLRDLRQGTVRSVAWPTGGRPAIALAARRIVISAPASDGRYRIYTSR